MTLERGISSPPTKINDDFARKVKRSSIFPSLKLEGGGGGEKWC